MSRLPASLASFVFVALVAACSGAPSPQGPASSSTASAPSGAVSAIRIQQVSEAIDLASGGIDSTGIQVAALTSWSPRYQLAWPVVAGARAFNDRLRAQAEQARDRFLPNSAPVGDAVPSLAATWSLVLRSPDLVGVRIAEEEFSGASTGHGSATYFGTSDGTRAWSGLDLISTSSRTDLVHLLDRAARTAGLRTGDEPFTTDDITSDITLDAHGDLELRFAKSALTDADRGAVLAHIPADVARPLLSSQGREVAQAMHDSALAQRSSSSALPSTGTASESGTAPGRTDCSVARCIALTFDDGPGPYTGDILDALETRHARATFFVLGPNVQADPVNVRRAARLGMAIGDHTWTHRELNRLDDATVTAEITRTARVIKAATGQLPFGVRPPYGAFTRTTPHAGYPFILWNVDTEDWKNHDAAITTRRALDGARRGAIVLMHDSHPSTAAALPGIIDTLQARGFTLVTVPELLGTTDPGRSYYSGA